MIYPIQEMELEKECRERYGIGYETFRKAAQCAEMSLEDFLAAPVGSARQVLYRDWLMELLFAVERGAKAETQSVQADVDMLLDYFEIPPQTLARYCGAEDVERIRAIFAETPFTEREKILFRLLTLKGALAGITNRAVAVQVLESEMQ